MDPELQAQLLQQAQTALNEGGNPAEIDRIITQQSGLPNMFALRMSVESAQEAQRAEAIERATDRGFLKNLGTSALQGASFSLMDDFLDLVGADDAAEGVRQAVSDFRESNPVAAGAAEIGGGLVLPGGAAATALKAGRGVTRATAVGGLLGGAGGAAFGFGEAEGPLAERFEDAAVPGVAGAAIGAATGGVGAFLAPRTIGRLFGGRAGKGPQAQQRVSQALQNRTGLSPDINNMRANAAARTQGIKEMFFDRLERDFPTVDDPEVLQILGEMSGSPSGREIMANVGDDLLVDGFRLPSFTELRAIRRELADTRNPLFDRLDDRMAKKFEGFAEGNRQLRESMAQEDAFLIGLGRKGTFRGDDIAVELPSDIDRALELLPESAHNNFRIGVLEKQRAALQGTERGGSRKVLQDLINDSEIDGRLRQMFPSDEAAESFIKDVRSNISFNALGESFRKLARFVGVAPRRTP